ncbi:hypothetical protein DIZ27_34665 [Streptomyces sp. NWU339]|uniref:hypothetical protein n=1 Tax=Streptomyces sp. NWU339 TaxID=2185284 RepID=UPI000D672CAB|nr:hypothetical protein [Streptomyces sp. NWU339]PWI06176.1 hypothetical protein DIZ27_34665 [Streptomyces sp. NWU339]
MGALGAATTWQVAERLTWSRGWEAVHGMMRRAALAETLAHLALLVERGRLARKHAGDGTGVLYMCA